MQQQRLQSWRFYSVVVVMLLLAAVLLWRMASLQVLPDADRGFEFLQGQGAARTVRTESISAYRGVITDRNGEPLAVSTPVESIWANPKVLLQHPKDWSRLSQALGWDNATLESRLAKFSGKEFMYLERHLPPHEAGLILDLGVDGVYSQREYRRYYPAGEVAAHLVGMTDIDDRGQEGMELAYDAWLAGESGAKQVMKDLRGRTIKELGLIKSARSGQPMALSIDLRLQYLAYRQLKQAVGDFGAKAGSVVVLDAKTGEVLAMANQPSYNPNDRSNIDTASLRNRAITDVFEPGSTIKPFAVMAALESGKFKPYTVIDTTPGYVQVGRKTLLDPVNYGELDLTRVIAKSSQVGMTKMALALEPDVVRNMYYRLGLGQGTGTGFPGEAVGVLPEYDHWKPIQKATYAFGYGLNLTVLQLAQAYAVIANEGVRRPVSLLRTDKPAPTQRVVAPEHAQAVMKMLRKVVSDDGTGSRAFIDAYPVAGKTGTAHKADAGGYADHLYIGSFVGVAPLDDPEIIVAVVIDEPRDTKYHGGQVAAPVFASITEGALRLLQEPPKSSASRLTVHSKFSEQVASSGVAL
ncbi:penicillin-binding transpeptidase domain-containing protein [Gilvimarinus sp. SDUM040013]|uniref:Peptidoglycan D,D-transpeptidase FtsI n=1 Tax=Gilvimarinus gilvus TaxID=3058038 RepID=A0ABU4RST5_9GAMM|nr:penicillin-binding transpeptidase domain-containing protein [Gilvimarinus sp. SDUM040013]MDO3388397.1 penicillin-binding transpeptidase domain-containing protein [Gilvimarinus sp. SDUM040013]MDX6847947.1 penicillin-binding transpeptidase domain-containing protein [Gilvimarinus sp. SDUM040013]